MTDSELIATIFWIIVFHAGLGLAGLRRYKGRAQERAERKHQSLIDWIQKDLPVWQLGETDWDNFEARLDKHFEMYGPDAVITDQMINATLNMATRYKSAPERIGEELVGPPESFFVDQRFGVIKERVGR